MHKYSLISGIVYPVTRPGPQFDVLVIGSGASGLAAAVSAERAGARVALATKGSLQANNSSKAQGGIQASFGDDDSPGAARRRRLPLLARDRRPRARRGAHRRRAVGDPLARGARRRVHARPGRPLPPRPLRRREREAPPPGRRPHGPRDHEAAARGVGGRRPAPASSTRRCASSSSRTATGARASASTTSRPAR